MESDFNVEAIKEAARQAREIESVAPAQAMAVLNFLWGADRHAPPDETWQRH